MISLTKKGKQKVLEGSTLHMLHLQYELLAGVIPSQNDHFLINQLSRYQTNLSLKEFELQLIECVLLACRIGRYRFVEFCLLNHLKKLDINTLFSYSTVTIDSKESIIVHSNTCLINNTRQTKTNGFLHFAAASGNVDLVSFLVKHGANTNICNCCNETPLYFGIGVIPVIDLLLKNDSQINHQDMFGSTPLILAVRHFSCQIVDHLLEVGADPWIKDKYGYNALDYSISDPHDDKVYDTFCSRGYVLKCEPSGQLSSFINSRKVQNVPIQKCLTPDVKLSLMFVDACHHIKNAPIFLNKLKNALFQKEKLNIQIEYSQPQPAYLYRHEISSYEELKGLVLDSSNASDIIWQAILILQRVAGATSALTLKYVYQYVIQDLLLSKDESLTLYEHYTQQLLLYMNQNYPEPNFSGVIRNSYPSIQALSEIDFTKQDNVIKVNAIFSNLASCVHLYLQYLSSLHCHNQTLLNMKHDSEFVIIIRSSIIVMYSLITSSLPGSCELALKLLDVFLSDILLYDKHSTTILHESIGFASVTFVKWVIESGGGKWINTPNSVGNYPMHTAILTNYSITEVIQLLLDHGAHVDAVNHQNVSSLQLATKCDKDCAAVLKMYYPLPLYCLASKAIIACTIPYQRIDLPRHIKKLIKYHDPALFVQNL